jgi:hypothetical protein
MPQAAVRNILCYRAATSVSGLRAYGPDGVSVYT